MFSGGWVVHQSGQVLLFHNPPKNKKRIDHPLGAIDLKIKYLVMRTISAQHYLPTFQDNICSRLMLYGASSSPPMLHQTAIFYE
jgi:hypothetical protein